MSIKEEILNLLPLRDGQIGIYTDTVLIRDKSSGKCGLGSCIYIMWSGEQYAITCAHCVPDGSECIAGAKRLEKAQLPTKAEHSVAPLKLIKKDEGLDLALMKVEGIDLNSVPAECYAIEDNHINFDLLSRSGVGAVSFIHGVPGFLTSGDQCPDGVVFLSAPIYSAHGPIIEITETKIIADFAEKECVEANTKAYPKIAHVKLTGGARGLGGMSGSGLWGFDGKRFQLLGMLLGKEAGNNDETEHKIKFLPIWKIKAWIAKVLGPKAGSM